MTATTVPWPVKVPAFGREWLRSRNPLIGIMCVIFDHVRPAEHCRGQVAHGHRGLESVTGRGSQ
jgi:hypothetical protein